MRWWRRSSAIVVAGAAALLVTGLPAPTAAAGIGEVTLVHGVRGLVADITVDGERVLEAFQPERLAGPLPLAAGPHQVEVRATGAASGSPPLLRGTIEVIDGARRSAAVHLNAAGAPAISVFDDDAASVPPGRARIVVRHVAATPGLRVTVDDASPRDLTSGNGTAFDVAAGTHVVAVRDATSAALLPPRELTFAEGTSMALYLVGAADANNLAWLAEVLPTAAAAPSAVRSGNSPLQPQGSSPATTTMVLAAGLLVIAICVPTGAVVRTHRNRGRVGGAAIGFAGLALGCSALTAVGPSVRAERALARVDTTPKLLSSPVAKVARDGGTALLVPPTVRPAHLDDVEAELAKAAARGARPRTVAIEPGGIVAPVTAVGADPLTGEMQIPSDPSTVGWYAPGARPGERGSAVIAGHVAFDGHRGALATLVGVEPGAVVLVSFDDDTVQTFRVTQRTAYSKADLPTGDLFGRDGPARLVLITCGGTFDHGTRTYQDNVVVVATPI